MKNTWIPSALSFGCFVVFMTNVVVAQTLPTPVARWDLNGSGADLVGNSPATANNVQWVNDSILGAERQVAYLGAGGTLFVPKTSALDLHSGGFTLMGWVKSPDFSVTPGPNTFFTLIDSQGVGDAHQSAYTFRYSASAINFQFSTQDVYPSPDPGYRDVKFFKTDESTPDLMQSNTWNHLAVVYNGLAFSAYVNGVELQNYAGNNLLNSSSTYVSDRQTGIGIRSDGGTGIFDPSPNGYIADVRIYNQSLSAAQIAYISTQQIPTVELSLPQSTAIRVTLGGSNVASVTVDDTQSPLPEEWSLDEQQGQLVGTIAGTNPISFVLESEMKDGAPSLRIPFTFHPQKGQSIAAFARIPSQSFRYTPLTVALPASSSGLPIELSVKSGPATLTSSNQVTFTGIGRVVLAANQLGNTNVSAAREVSTSFLVNKGAQTITFPTLNSVPFVNGNTFQIVATASSELPVTFRSSNTRVLTISGATATIVGRGKATITATQAGDARWNPARAVTRSITVF